MALHSVQSWVWQALAAVAALAVQVACQSHPGTAGAGGAGAQHTSLSTAQQQSSEDDVFANRAAVVTLAVVGVVCVFSLCVAGAGIAVALQYPHPHCLCWHTYRSDVAGNRGCCSLYRSNVGLAMVWVLFSTIMAITRSLVSLAICVAFTLLHLLAVYLLRKAFRQHGYPLWPSNASGLEMEQMGRMTPAADLSFTHSRPPPVASPLTSLGQHQAAGMPVYNIPLIRAEVGLEDPKAPKCSCATCHAYQQADLMARLNAHGSYQAHAGSPGIADGALRAPGSPATASGRSAAASALAPRTPTMASGAGIGRFRGEHTEDSSGPQRDGSFRQQQQQPLESAQAAGAGSNSEQDTGSSSAQGQGVPSSTPAPVLAHPVHESMLVVSGTPVGLQRLSSRRPIGDGSTDGGTRQSSSTTQEVGAREARAMAERARQHMQRAIDSYASQQHHGR